MTEPDTTALFEFCAVGLAGRNGHPRLSDVNVTIPAAGVTVIIGPSGSGKSSLLRLGNRLEAADDGEVRFRGRDVRGIDPLELRRQVGMIFQRPVTFAGSVRDNLLVADPSGDDERFCVLLDRAGLREGFLDRVADELSGGEGQRVCLARALATDPEVLLADEPTSSLDPGARRQIEQLGRSLADDGVPIVWVTQDHDQIDRLADHVIVIIDGRVAHQSPMDHLRDGVPPDVLAFLDDPQ